MRSAVFVALVAVSIGTAIAQPAPKPAGVPNRDGALFWQPWPASGWLPANDPKMTGAYFKLEVLGWLWIEQEPIDADPKTLQIYSRRTGVGIGPAPDGNLARPFSLFLGGPGELVKAARQLNQKWVVVEGDLVIVHGPVQLLFGLGTESLGQTEYAHAPPRYVIKVRRLTAAPVGVPNEKQEPYIKVDVRGVLKTKGTNPSLDDISAGFAAPSTVVRTDQCNISLYLGQDNKWLAGAKGLNEQAVVARGELITVAHDPPGYRPGMPLPPPIFLLKVADLKPAPTEVKKDEKK